MRRLFSVVLALCIVIVPAQLLLCADSAQFPIRGLHLSAPLPADLEKSLTFIREALPKEGVNVLILEINYHYQFSKRPEVVDSDALSREDVKKLVAACRQANVRLIPMINCLGHQSWAKTTFGLLKSHPEFDETPGKYPNNADIYCRSYCPLNPGVHEVLFDLIDELADAFEADAFHVGMDEVFLLGEDDCPRCKGKNKAQLFAGEVQALHDHLAKSNRTLWMWGDRFLEGKLSGLGKWEASENDTWPSVNQVSRDIVICDWHYDNAEPTAAYFALEGFPVVYSPWRMAEVALGELDIVRLLRKTANPTIAARAQGMLQTTWCGMAEFVKAYNGETTASKAALEAAYCFKTLFAEMRRAGFR